MSWAGKLVISLERHEVGEISIAGGKRDFPRNRQYMNIPAGTVVLCVKDFGDSFVFIQNENNWESLKGRFSMCESSDKLAGKNFCFTGALPFVRDFYRATVQLHGGEIRSSVTLDTTHLVMASKKSLSIKAKKAKADGVTMLDENEFWSMIGTATKVTK